MSFYMKLPRSGKEFVLFILIVSIISVNLISPAITFLEVGFSKTIYFSTLKIIPIMWIFIVILVLLTHWPAEKLSNKIVKKGDSFNSVITINILCNVLLMSIFMTIIGTWIGSSNINLEVFHRYFYIWPRNFAISLGVELLITQPIARYFIYRLHVFQDTKVENDN